MSLKILFTTCLLICFGAFACAQELESVISDYTPLSGSVIMPVGNEYIIDLDEQNSLNVGDILAVVEPGQAIVDSEGRGVVGRSERIVGFLQVTKMASGYSYATPLSGGEGLSGGANLRRFEQVPSLMIVDDKDRQPLAEEIQKALSQFDWKNQEESEVLLKFKLTQSGLEVFSREGEVLHSYSATEGGDLKKIVTDDRSVAADSLAHEPEPRFLQKVANSVVGMVGTTEGGEQGQAEGTGSLRQREMKNAWIHTRFSDEPVGIAVSDFDQDGQNEMAVAFSHALIIARVADQQLQLVASIDMPPRVSILSVGSMDLDGAGGEELCVTAVDEISLASFAVQHTQNGYVATKEKVKWYLRVAQTSEGKKVLIGQEQGSGSGGYSGAPFTVNYRDGNWVRGGALSVPGKINLFSHVAFDQQSRPLYAHLTEAEYLQVVNAAGDQLWESSEYFGGSESCYQNRAEHEGDMVVPICLGPGLVKTDKEEILVVQNEAQRFLKQLRTYSPSRLVALSWNGSAMQENWRTVSQKGYLADFALGDVDNDGAKEVATLVRLRRTGLFEKDRTAIITYSLQ